MDQTWDFLVVGSGISGLWFALRAAEHGTVCVVTKREAIESNTRYAQGGVAAVMSVEDSVESHVADTLVAGAGLCDEDIVRLVVREGPQRVRELIGFGVEFTRDEAGDYDLGMEGGHSHRRVLHADDMTGRAIAETLVRAVQAHPRIDLLEKHFAIDVIKDRHTPRSGRTQGRCLGVYALDKTTGQVRTLRAAATVLAAGGCGKVYLYTSNPDVATGDGIAMAYRAGCRVSNMEFVQFHPTALYHSKAKNFLISEALRGEGGELRNADGVAFMQGKHPLGSLAPRDIVARGIDFEMKRTGADCVFLDMTHLSRHEIEHRFPNIHAECLGWGIDMVEQPIPVVPAAHYCCGGVRVKAHGETDIPGLYAIGETACTGLHGANRLASNSLLEGLVFAERSARHAADFVRDASPPAFERVADWNRGDARAPDEEVIVTQSWDELRRLMWNYVGIVRTTKRLLRARRRVDSLLVEINHDYWEYDVTSDFLELRNIATVARLVVESALRRHESRGIHYTLDYPGADDAVDPTNTVLDRLVLEGAHWLRG